MYIRIYNNAIRSIRTKKGDFKENIHFSLWGAFFHHMFSAGHQHYNFRNHSRLLPKIKHEFPRQSLRYKLISTLNETSNELLEMAKSLSQKNFMNFVRNEILIGYR